MTPELTLLTINAVLLGYGYIFVYPRLAKTSMKLLKWRGGAISGAAMVVAGMLYWGSGVQFSLFFFHGNWFVFSFVTLLIMDSCLFLWFMKKHGLTLDDLE